MLLVGESVEWALAHFFFGLVLLTRLSCLEYKSIKAQDNKLDIPVQVLSIIVKNQNNNN